MPNEFYKNQFKSMQTSGVQQSYSIQDPNSEFRTIVENEIILQQPNHESICFDNVVGHTSAKQLLNEAVVLPLIIPEFFQEGLQEPWKGVLLFGPPGTGKTMLARSVANMNGISFFNCSASALVNKYRGESEKMLKCVFEMARERGPSIVFFDEIDSLFGSRGNGSNKSSGNQKGNESIGVSEGVDESSRRLLTELLKQIDGIESGKSLGDNNNQLGESSNYKQQFEHTATTQQEFV